MKLILTNEYKRKEKKFLKKNKNLFSDYQKTVRKLIVDPFDPSLKIHKLKGDLSDFHSCSVTYSHRLVIYLEITKDSVTLIDIGTHDEVYGK